MKIKALYKYVYTFVDEKGSRYPYRYSLHLLSCFFCYYEDIMIYLITATGKYLPNRFLANSPSTSSELRGFK